MLVVFDQNHAHQVGQRLIDYINKHGAVKSSIDKSKLIRYIFGTVIFEINQKPHADINIDDIGVIERENYNDIVASRKSDIVIYTYKGQRRGVINNKSKFEITNMSLHRAPDAPNKHMGMLAALNQISDPELIEKLNGLL